MKTFFTHLLIQLSILITLWVSYAAWNDVINSGDPLTAAGWNDLVNKVADLDNFSFSGENVGIGVSNPNQKLQVEWNLRIWDGGYYQDLILETNNDGFTNGGFTIKPATTPGTWVANFYTYFKNSATSPTGWYTRHNIVIDGTAQKPGGWSWTTFSDARLKDISWDYHGGLELITQLDPKIFHYKSWNSLGWDSDTQHIGFIAQDVEKVFPDAVTQWENDYLQLDTQEIDIAIINAIKELKQENEALRNEIELLKNK